MPHQAEDIWQNTPECQRQGLESALLTSWPEPKAQWDNKELEDKFLQILKAREVVTRAIEPLRADKKVGSALEVGVYVKADDESVLKANEVDLADIYIVSQAQLTNQKPSEEILNEYSEDGYTIWVVKAKGEKCARCWKYRQLDENGICQKCKEALEN